MQQVKKVSYKIFHIYIIKIGVFLVAFFSLKKQKPKKGEKKWGIKKQLRDRVTDRQTNR